MRRIERYDVSSIERPTSADLEQLVRRRLDARRRGCELMLTGVGDRLRLLLAVTGLDEAFLVSHALPGPDEVLRIGDSPPDPDAQAGVPSG